MNVYLIWYGESVDAVLDCRSVTENEVKDYVYKKNDNGKYRIWSYQKRSIDDRFDEQYDW